MGDRRLRAADGEDSQHWFDERGTEWITRGNVHLYRLQGADEWTVLAFDDTDYQARLEARRERLAAERDSAIAAYTAHPCDAVAAWDYLHTHPAFWRWNVDVEYEHVPPSDAVGDLWRQITASSLLEVAGTEQLRVRLHRVDGRPQALLQIGPVWWPPDLTSAPAVAEHLGGISSIDPALTTTATTFEEAALALAAAVRDRYGDDRRLLPSVLGEVVHLTGD
ncbi:hypothetical protein GS504_01890 [Rhodococcus hoagii]|nr:hypothetical protein [Prescottella equi]NKS72223.1 hypothetical protein [Prescottella equi]